MTAMRRFFHRTSAFALAPFEKMVSYTLLGFWTFVVLFPIYWLVVTSLKLPVDVNTGPYYIPFVDFQPSLHAWQYIFVDLRNDTVRPFINTIVVGITSSVLALALGAAASYALVRFRYQPKLGVVGLFIGCILFAVLIVNLGVPWWIAVLVALALFSVLAQTIGKRFERALGNNDVAFWMVSQRILPPVAVVIPIYILFQQLKMLDTRTALILTYMAVNLPIVVWLLRDYFQSIPIELEESAAIDGASRFYIFWTIVLPLSVPGLVATFLFVLVFAWNEYLLALFLSSSEAQTMPLTVAAQNATRGPQWWYMSVLILIMIAPVIILAIILERYIARGLLVGAVKG